VPLRLAPPDSLASLSGTPERSAVADVDGNMGRSDGYREAEDGTPYLEVRQVVLST
jgi:hypothetical protein